MTESKAQKFLEFLQTLSPEPAITFRGHVDASITEGLPSSLLPSEQPRAA